MTSRPYSNTPVPDGTSIGEAHDAYFDSPELWRAIKEVCP
jgi:hypothetical protein